MLHRFATTILLTVLLSNIGLSQNYSYATALSLTRDAKVDLFKIDINNCTSERVMELNTGSRDLALNPVDNMLYLLGDNYDLYKIDPINKIVSIVKRLRNIAFQSYTFDDKGTLYLTNSNIIYKVNLLLDQE